MRHDHGDNPAGGVLAWDMILAAPNAGNHDHSDNTEGNTLTWANALAVAAAGNHTHTSTTTGNTLNAAAIAAGTLAHERGGLEADVNAYDAIPFITGGATTALTKGTWHPENLLKGGGFGSWGAGTSAAPDGWAMNHGGSIAQLATAGNVLFGEFSAEVTSDADGNRLTNTVMATIGTSDNTHFRGKTVTAGAWVKTSDASNARLRIEDGVSGAYSDFHTGGGAYEFLTVTRMLNASATSLSFFLMVEGNVKVAVIAGAILAEGTYLPAFYPHPLDTLADADVIVDSGSIRLLERSAPGTPGTNQGVMYAYEGAGALTAIGAKFQDGDVIVIAQEV